MSQYLKFPSGLGSGATEGEIRFDEFKRLLGYNWQTVISFPNLWFVVIDRIPTTLKGMDNTNIVNAEGPNQYKQLEQNQADLLTVAENNIGCLLAQGVVTPQMNVSANRPSVSDAGGGGYYTPPIINGMDAPEDLRIEFRETNSSFGDLIIKPWIELVAKNGLVARPATDPRYIKCTITLVELGLAGAGTEPVHRKVWTFHDCAPVQIVGTSHTYDDHTQAVLRDTNWVYTHWDIKDVIFDNINDLFEAHQTDAGLISQIRYSNTT
jgi:hypothetical protein